MSGHSQPPSDHDLLIRMDERVQKLDRCMTNHLAHHWAVTLAALAALLSSLGAIGLLTVQLVFGRQAP